MTIDLKRTPIRIAKHQGFVELSEHKSFVKYLGLNLKKRLNWRLKYNMPKNVSTKILKGLKAFHVHFYFKYSLMK